MHNVTYSRARSGPLWSLRSLDSCRCFLDRSAPTPSNMADYRIVRGSGTPFGWAIYVIAIEYVGEILVTVLASRLIWLVLRSDRSFHHLERGIQTAVLAGLVFLIVTPFISSKFYFVVSQPDSRPVTAALSIGRNVSVGLLTGGIILLNRW